METVWTSFATVIMTLLVRDGLPRLGEFLKGFRADTRKGDSADRKAKREDAEIEELRTATTVDGWKEIAANWQCLAEKEKAERDAERKELTAKLEAERKECREQLGIFQNRLTIAEIKLAKQDAVIEYLREHYGIKTAEGGSDLHRVPPQLGGK